MKYILIILLFLPLTCSAGLTIDNCRKFKVDTNQYNLCMAEATLTVSYCERVRNMDLQTHCRFMIIQQQRRALANSGK